MKNLSNQKVKASLFFRDIRLPKNSAKKNLSRYFLFTALLALSTTYIFSQSSGDYRSNAPTMNWNNPASWQQFDGTAWSAATDYPGQNACSTCTITIRNGNTVTLNVSPANSVGNIIVGTGTSGIFTLGTFTLNIAGDFTVESGASLNLSTGTINVAGNTVTSGNITDASNTGVNTFAGMVTKTGGNWTSSAVSTAANMVFKKGFTNTAGAFNAGAATAGDSSILVATSPMLFSNIFSAMGALSIDGSGGVTFSNNTTITGDLIISGGAAVALTATGFITVNGTTTNHGSFTDNANNGINTFTKLVTNNGRFDTDSVTTASNLRLNGGFTNEVGATCNINSVRLAGSITGNAPVTIKGAVTTNGAVIIAGGAVTISGADNAVFSGSLTIKNGATFTVSTSGTFTATTTTNNGAFTDDNNSSLTTFTGLFTNTGTTDFSALSTANIIFNNGIIHTSGVFNVPTATIATTFGGNDITATSTVNFSAGVNFTGNGTLTISGAGGVVFSGSADIIVPAALQVASLSSVIVSTTGNFTVTATTTLAGSFTDNENTGVTTFTGLVTKSGGVFNSVAVTTPAKMIFQKGITQTGGSFNAGGASVPQAITLSSTPAMTFNNPLEIGGTGNITIAGTGGVVLAGAAIDYFIPGNLTLTGLLTVSTTGNFTVNGVTSMTGAGGFTDNENTGISTFKGLVTHNSTGKWTSTAVTTAANLLFNEDFVNSAGIFAAGAATIEDNKILKGTVNMAFANGLNIKGNGDITIAGTATTGVSLGGTLTDYSVRNITITGRLTISTTGNFTVTGTTTISSTGNFLDNNNNGVTLFTGLITVGSTATFTTTSVSTVGRLLIEGGIVQQNTAAGAFSAGAIRTTATQTWSGAGSISTGGILDINAGTLTNNLSGTVTAGGTLTGVGTSWVQGANAILSLNSSNPATITTLISNTPGNTIIYGSATNATIKTQPYFNLTIAGTNNKAVPSADLTIAGNLTISSGVLTNAASGRTINVSGNWINNAGAASFDAGAGTVAFAGTDRQILGGTAVTTFKNLIINNMAGVYQNNTCKVTGLLNIIKGNINTGDNLVSISSTGAVVRTGGYISGNEQLNFTTGSNIARTFDVGDSAAYAPVYLIFSGVTTSGSVTVKTTGADHPSIGNSLINNNRSLNRYWTITNNGVALSGYTAVLNFAPADKDPALNTAGLLAGVYNNSWSYLSMTLKTPASIQVTNVRTFGDLAFGEQKDCTNTKLVINTPPDLCLPATVDLTAPAITAGSDTNLVLTYWNNAAATSALSIPEAVRAGTYYIKGSVPDGSCTAIKPVIIRKQNPTADIQGTTDICAGDSVRFTLTFTGKAPWTGTLSDGTTFNSNSNSFSLNLMPQANTNYTIATATDASGCMAQSSDKTGIAAVTIVQPATLANAGPDQETCGEFVTLVANTPVTGNGNWSVLSGNGGWFSNSVSPVTNFSGIPGVTYVLQWAISNGICPSSKDNVTVKFNSGLWTGAKDTNWANPENWCGGTIPTGIINLALPAGLRNYPVITDSVTINNLLLTGGASIKISGWLTIRGTYRNAGTLTNNGTIILDGPAPKNFPGYGAILAMKNLTVSCDSGVYIDRSFAISGMLKCSKGTIDLDDKYITLLADSAGTASVAPVNGKFAYSFGGRFIVQRYVPARKAWRLITAPVTSSSSIFSSWQNNQQNTPGNGTFIYGPVGGNGLDAAGSSTLKTFDTAMQMLVPVVNTLVPVSPGAWGNADNAGYFIYINGDRSNTVTSPDGSSSTTLNSSGKLQTGTQIHKTDYVAGKYTLVGNPYASAVDFGKLEKTNITNRFYAWDPALNQVGGYVVIDDAYGDGTYSSSVASASQSAIIAPSQAFFVQTVKDAFGSVIFHEESKVDGTAITGARPKNTSESLDAELYLLNTDSTTILADGAKALFSDDYSDSITLEDALKFTNVNENFSWNRNDTSLSIERRKIITDEDTLFLRLTKSSLRSYQIKFTGSNMDSHKLAAVLVDKYLKTETPVSLNGTTKFNFSVTADSASAPDNRFYITFHPTDYNATFTTLKAYRRDNNIAIEWQVSKERGIVKYEVQKGVNGIDFTTIASTPATGNLNNSVAYSKLDTYPVEGSNFYRIKSTDLSGNITFSEVANLKMGTLATGISIFPNPIHNNTLNLQFANQVAGKYAIALTATGSGQQVFSQELMLTAGNSTVPVKVQRKLAAGFYNLTITTPDATKTTLQVMVQ